MKIDITSMFFNSKIEGQTATPAWGTSIGQNKSKKCRIDDFKQEVVDMVIGMTYKSISDRENLDVSKGSTDRDIITCSVFNDVYINNQRIDNAQYVLLLVREHSKSHDGRLLISYAPYIKYNGVTNQDCINKMQSILGCTDDGCWFVYDISIKNQAELYFSAVVVNPTSPMIYASSTSSRERSIKWKSMIPGDYEDFELAEPLQQIFYGAPGTGKSHKIKDHDGVKKADEKNLVFRTTFHPDSDYSTFVGCYKPTKVKTRKQQRLNLSLEDLAKELGGYYTNEELGKIAGIQKFCFEYHPYIDGEYMSVNVSKLLELAGIPKDYNVEINKYVKFCHLIPKQDPDKITYEFVPQAFLQSYVAAWNNPDENVFLVIEEINRGNCAQIFGDLFQLLDRDCNGFSEYPIMADNDLAKYLIEGKDENGNDVLTNKDGIKDGKLRLPNNLYIWATMNTSDQSLFPIDSAFKRRWEWVYMPIDTKKENWHIQVGDSRYSWTAFLDKVNDELLTDETAEDKHLGFYFCKAVNGIISKETFVAKVLFYLWTDVFKVYGVPSAIGSGKDWSYAKFYNPDGSVNETKVKELMAKLQIEVVASTSTEDETTEIESN